MSAHVLFVIQVEEKRYNAWQASHFNKFNNTRAQMLDSIYHMTLRLL